MDIGDRIRILRKELGLNQTDFGNVLSVKQTSVAGWETGSRFPSASVVSLICREWNVNENWLRTGEGEMFNEQTLEEELTEFFADVMIDEGFKKRFVRRLAHLSDEGWEMLADFAEGLMKETEQE